MVIDLAAIARDLKKPVEQIETALKLLDDGNTIPFVTRFRKDETGGLDEEALQFIQQRVAKIRAIDERRAFVLKSVESQGKLNDQLAAVINAATSSRELEDVYLPFKPKKQNLASQAKQGGLEPLAMDVFESRSTEIDLATRATDFVRVDKGLKSVDDVIKGVGYILAEKFADRGDVRALLRKWVWENGKLFTTIIGAGETSTKASPVKEATEALPKPAPVDPATDPLSSKPNDPSDSTVAAELPASESQKGTGDADQPKPLSSADVAEPKTDDPVTTTEKSAPETGESVSPPPENPTQDSESQSATTTSVDSVSSDAPQQPDEKIEPDVVNEPPDTSRSSEVVGGSKGKDVPAVDAAGTAKKKKKKKKKKKPVDDPFKDYHDFQTPLKNIPHYRVLAINRGERASKLRVKIKLEDEQLIALASEHLVPADHPNAEFMKSCVKDALHRLIMPSLEREIRRELTDGAERQAVTVFAHNLKNLLLQAPVQNQRILAIDPGYKRGCSVVAMDSCGKILESAHIFVVGNQQRKTASTDKIVELVNKHKIDLIAIGNGAACREAEQMVSDSIANHFAEQSLKYAMVNEAGASFYSTSEIGREELPKLSPAVRSAVSIGRRLMDPLSELVKISPANIGVGMYQHDVKAKHLSDSLDEVVRFCVNRVGVNVNTASPSLLRYVSGLNQLTARRVFEYRETNGPFKNRLELKNVTGFGDATFVQSAGFLRVRDGNQPLDSTAIHPESYPFVETVINRVEASLEEIFPQPLNESDVNQSEKTDTPESVDPAESTAVEGAPADPTNDNIEPKADLDSSQSAEPKAESMEAPPTHPETPPSDGADTEPASTIDPKGKDTKESQPANQNKTARQPSPYRLSPEVMNRRKEIVRSLRELDIQQLAVENNVGKMLAKDVLQVLCRPGYDPRNKINRPVFRKGILKFDELKPELQLDAQVVNVVDFGVFVDIGLGTSCLVHVSQLANRYIRDPHEIFAVGDVLQVWVTEVDATQRRVKLTAIRPGSKSKPDNKRGQTRRGSGNSKRHVAGSKRPANRRDRQPDRKTRFKKGQEKSRRRPPKPVKPITDEMLSGNAPMRSFSDLSQFYDKKSDTDKPNDVKEKNE